MGTSSFPCVIGATDGTHINIPAPHKHPETYVNCKGHHSIQLQVFYHTFYYHCYTLTMYDDLFSFIKAVCDHQCRYTHCFVGNVGSAHDQRVNDN